MPRSLPCQEILTLNGGMAWLAIATVLIAFLSETLTGTLNDAAHDWGLGSQFVGCASLPSLSHEHLPYMAAPPRVAALSFNGRFVILPIVGNAAEHSTAIVMAFKSKMDLAFGVALGSSTQIALFVIPVSPLFTLLSSHLSLHTSRPRR